ncbi:hypothetical protein A2Z33_02485 [Candidatus Gottesmanbacteria bacterium RBG_16_52_11]|uniref:NIF system FeS cluster assembly NifU N-terminal domain-containing protein n=1 Tax=Candidatus Gottesmanbacteria bacterium RBG_16_52_11 TaxID=1798374 RepID=A0A1F5YMG0_9BACT|nr:MAG: hypothetical protein A2Z33_02485 [Candidatus Gottesmanbacteria bacterium RBG_16_52_11]
MDIYRDIILDHYKNPRNFGTLDGHNAAAEEFNATCGDRIRMEIRISGTGEGATVSDIRFSGVGCAISQAAASMLTERAKGMKVRELLTLKGNYMLDMLDTRLTPSRVKCATLPLEVIQKAAGISP